MTGPIMCPECGGSGLECYGPLTVSCGFCSGRGEVGGCWEAAGEADPPEGYGPPVWEDAAVAALPGCHVCLGAGVVVGLGGGTVGWLVTEPCPECSSPSG